MRAQHHGTALGCPAADQTFKHLYGSLIDSRKSLIQKPNRLCGEIKPGQGNPTLLPGGQVRRWYILIPLKPRVRQGFPQ